MLTDRQLEVVKHLANGMTLSQIADKCYVSESSVNRALARARKNLGANTLPHLVSIAIAKQYLVWTDDNERDIAPETEEAGTRPAPPGASSTQL